MGPAKEEEKEYGRKEMCLLIQMIDSLSWSRNSLEINSCAFITSS